MALTDSLLAYWPLDEASGNAIDAHAANDLTENGTGGVGSATGKVGNCRDFENGDQDRFSIAGTGDFSLGDEDFTFAGWMNFESLGANRTVLGKWLTTGNQRSFGLLYLSASTVMRFQVSSTGSNTVTVDASTFGAPSTSTWYFVVCWHDSVNNQIGISVNDTANTAAHSAGIFDSTADFELGRATSLVAFDGLLDEWGFWNRVLSSGERTALYNGGAGLAYPFASGNRRRRVLIGGGVA